MSAGPWSGVRVVEAGGLTGAYATRMWAALGAEVIVAEPPGGHRLRHLPPFADDAERTSLWWAFFGQGKTSVVVEPASPEYDDLLASADVVITEVDPAVSMPTQARPDQIVVTVSPFGLSGPRHGWKSSELVSWASSGLAFTFGFPDRPPLAPAIQVQMGAHITSLYAVAGAMLALRARRQTGRGQIIDLSIQECCLSLAPETGVVMFLDDHVHRSRPGNRRAVTRPWGLYPCTDGYVAFLVLQPNHWKAMAEWIAEATGVDAILDPAFADMRVRWEVSDFMDELTEQLTASKTKLELFIEGQRRGIPTTPVNTVADLRSDPHLASAGFWRTDNHPTIGPVASPGAPFRVNHDWWHWSSAPT